METVQSPFTRIFKRDGSVAEFDFDRIVDAIFSAAQAVGGKNRDLAAELAHEVMDRLQAKTQGERPPAVEEIQDTIEKTLIEAGHARTAKAFILYRQRRKEIRETRSSFLAIEGTVDQYLQGQVGRPLKASFPGLARYASESVLSHYALNKIYPAQISEAHRDGALFIHDLGSAICGNSLLVKKPANAPTPDHALGELKKIQGLSQEWADRVILEDFEETLRFWRTTHDFLKKEEGRARFYLTVQQPQLLANLVRERKNANPSAGLIVKGALLKQHIIDFPVVLSHLDDYQTNTDALLGILPLSSKPNLPRTNLGVVSLNLKRAAQESPSKKAFLARLETLLAMAKHALQIKKKVFEQNFDAGLFPETQHETGRESRAFLTVGLAGLFQASASWAQDLSQTSQVLTIAQEIVNFVKDRLRSFQEETLQPFAIDFIGWRSCPFYEAENPQLHEDALHFPELLPFMTLKDKAHSLIQILTSKMRPFLAWIRPAPTPIELQNH